MARYNHFSKIENNRVSFSSLEVGAEFSLTDKPFRKCIKTGNLEYRILKTNEVKVLFADTLSVYVKQKEQKLNKGMSL